MQTKVIDFYNLYHKKNRNDVYSSVISDNNFTYFHTLKWLRKALVLFSSSKKIRILDLGCGVGTIDFYLAQKSYQVTGVDISKDAIGICHNVKKKLGLKDVEFIHGDVEKMKFSEKFDFILCSEVIEHVQDDVKLLKRVFDLLKPGGILLLTTPSLNAPLYRLGLLKDFDRRVGHLRRYEMDGLNKLIQRAGMQVLETDKTEGVLRNSLFTFPYVGYLIKGIKGPLVPIFHAVDQLVATLVGESDLVVLARKPKLIASKT